MTFNGEKVFPVQEVAKALDMPDVSVKGFINVIKNREAECKNYLWKLQKMASGKSM